jgi:hypothetical protein|tara:strand:+ start:141 stop:488 length:348 start_codon:yes stop_codon:yes gene_type:complete
MDLWTMLKQIEKSGDCVIYGVLEVQGVAEDLSYWREFDKSEPTSEHFIMDSHDIPKQMMLDGFQYALNRSSCEYDNYNYMVEMVGEYLIEKLKERQCVCGDIDCEEEYACTTSGY